MLTEAEPIELLMLPAMSDKSPFGLDEWLVFLQGKKFPVNSDNLMRLKNQIKSPDETLDHLQKNIHSEPLLAFVILSEANRIVANKRTDIKTPTHAASMVGMNGLAKLLHRLLPCDFSRKNQTHQDFQRQIQISYEAASIAQRWALEKRSNNPEDIFWITFFRDAIRWMMWFYAHEQMQAMTDKLKRGHSSKSAEESILGCRLDALTVKLFQLWQIPLVIINTFLTDHIPTPKELQLLASLAPDPDQIPGYTEDKRLTILANSPLLLAFCATKVAHDANNIGWGAKNLKLYYQIIACVLHCRQGRVIQATHFATVEAANLYSHSEKIPIACQLLSPTLYLEAQKNAEKTVTDSPLVWLQKRAVDKKINNKQLIKDTLKVLKSTISNTQHALILQYNKKTNRQSPILQFGYDIEALKKINWNTTSSILDRLKQKRSAVNLPSQKLNNILGNFPLSARQIIDENGHLLLASCPQHNGDCMLIWLDTREKFLDSDFEKLKKILLIVSKPLHQNTI